MADTDHPGADHPLKPTRPTVPEAAQPKSTESHPAHIDDFTHDATVAHETSDVNVRAIAIFIVVLVVVAVVIHIGLLGLMGLFAKQASDADRAITPLAAPAGTPPPEPRLLRDEPGALQQLRNEEAARLKDIDRAKQDVVGTLPARADGQAPAGSAARSATRMDTSSGRKQ